MKGIGLLFAAVVALAFAATACSGDDPDSNAATVTPSPLPEATATLPPAPTSTPVVTAPTPLPGVQRVPSTVWLIDALTGRKSDIFEDLDALVIDAAFAHGNIREVHVVHRPDIVSPDLLRTRVGLDGKRLLTEPKDEVCRQTQGGIEVRGRRYDAMYCGPISQDGHWLLFEKLIRQVPSPPGSNYLVPETEMWVLDLTTGAERKVQEGLIHCGGCDGRFGPGFSASGRYAYFAETGGKGRVWLADLEAGTARQISAGQAANQQGYQPDFSPADDTIVYFDAGQQTVIEDLTTGESRVLTPAGLPGRFDSTGQLVYVVEGSPREPQRTHVFMAGTGQALATVPGAPSSTPYWVSEKPSTLAAMGNSFLAALENAPGCAGTAIYRGAIQSECLAGRGASVSPDGRYITFARDKRYTGPVQYPGGGAVALVLYDVVLYELASGNERVVASDAVSSEQVPPVLVWNNASTHFLVRWPLHPGL